MDVQPLTIIIRYLRSKRQENRTGKKPACARTLLGAIDVRKLKARQMVADLIETSRLHEVSRNAPRAFLLGAIVGLF